MYFGACERCGGVQSEAWTPGVACGICAAAVPARCLCPACLAPNDVPTDETKTTECRHCSLPLPPLAMWARARALLAAGAERLTYRDRLREWPVAGADILADRREAQAAAVRARIAEVAALLEPKLLGRGLLNDLQLSLVARLPQPAEHFDEMLGGIPVPAGTDAANLEAALEAATPWELRSLIGVIALRAGSASPAVRGAIDAALPIWGHSLAQRSYETEPANHMALECLATYAHWRIQAAWPRTFYGTASAPWTQTRLALFAHRFVEHPTLYASWARAICVTYLARHDRRVRGDEDNETGKTLAAFRAASEAIIELARKSLADAAPDSSGTRDLRFTLALALGDEATLEQLTHVEDDAGLKDAALRAYAAFGGRLSSLRTTRLRQSIAAASPEDAIKLIRALPRGDDPQVIELLVALIPITHADVSDAAWGSIRHVPFASLTAEAQQKVLDLTADPSAGRLDVKQALDTFQWLVREAKFPFAADARLLLPTEICRALVLATPVDDRYALVNNTYGFDDWLAAAVAMGRADFSSWSHDASDDTLKELLYRLESLEGRLELPLAALPGTWPTVAALWQALPVVRRDAAADIFRSKWFTRGLARRDQALTAWAERFAANPTEQRGVLTVCADDLDGLIAALEKVGAALFANAATFYRDMAPIPAVNAYDLLQRVLPKVEAAAFGELLSAVFDVARALFPRGSTRAIPPLKLMMATAEKRLEDSATSHDAYLTALSRLAEGWQDLARDAVAAGWPDTNGHYFESFAAEIVDTRSRVDRAAQKRVDADRRKAEQEATAELRRLRDEQQGDEKQRRAEEDLARQREMAEEQAKLARNAARTMAAMAQRQVLMAQFQQDCAAVMASTLDPSAKAARVAELARDLQAAMATLT